MASEDLKKLMDLIFNQKFKVLGGGTNFKPMPEKPGCFVPNTNFILQKDDKEVNFKSNEADVTFLGLSFRHTLDQSGNMALASYKDLNKYYDTFDYLKDEDRSKVSQTIQKLITWAIINEDTIKKLENKIDINKLKEFINKEIPRELLIYKLDKLSFSLEEIREILKNALIKESFKFDYEPEKLLHEFLLSNKRNSKKFEKLRQHHFEILAHFVLESKKYLTMLEDKTTINNNSALRFKEYSRLIEEILLLAFRKTIINPIKNYLEYTQFITLDFYTYLNAAEDEIKFINESLKILTDKGNVDIDFGLKSFLDYYRRESELASHFINSIRIAIELIQDNKNPEEYKKYIDNCKIIESVSYYSKLIKNLDPRIRHSESHINTKIDKSSGKVVITEIIKEKRVPIVEYTFEEIIAKTLDLHQSFFPALITSFYTHKLALTLEVLFSNEYLILLLGIDNIK